MPSKEDITRLLNDLNQGISGVEEDLLPLIYDELHSLAMRFMRNERPGQDYLERVRDHFKHCAWLNPMQEDSWSAPSIRLVKRIFPMYPLTVEGVERLALDLSRG